MCEDELRCMSVRNAACKLQKPCGQDDCKAHQLQGAVVPALWSFITVLCGAVPQSLLRKARIRDFSIANTCASLMVPRGTNASMTMSPNKAIVPISIS